MAGALDAFNQLEKRQQIAIVVGVPVLIVGLLGYLSWGQLVKLGPDPQVPGFLQRPVGLWSEINAANEGIVAQEAVIATGPEIERQLKALSDEIALAEDRLPLEAEKTEVRVLIEKLAREIPPSVGQVEFKAVRIVEGGVVKGQDYQPITYMVEIQCDLNGAIKYIDSIEKNVRFMMVRNLSLTPGTLSLDPGSNRVVSTRHSVNLEIVTYVYTAGQKRRGK